MIPPDCLVALADGSLRCPVHGFVLLPSELPLHCHCGEVIKQPERSADEQARIAAICRACANYGPATDEPGMGVEVCLCGCAGVKRENRPPLGAVWKMAGGRCLDDKVKAW